jgi:hypothetical protein
MTTETKTRSETMTYSAACELLGLTTPKALARNAEFAQSILRCLKQTAPLQYKVACQVIIDAVTLTPVE